MNLYQARALGIAYAVEGTPIATIADNHGCGLTFRRIMSGYNEQIKQS